jgi:Tfp pilus assembly protein PilF
MKTWAVLLLSLILAGCASTPVTQRPGHLFNDHLFAAASERVGAEDVFALSDEMKRYLSAEIAGPVRSKGPQKGLFDALYLKGQLKLEYDAVMTRNAAQAFAARSGNCLSLVIMTAAFAKEMGLSVRYQSALLEDTWSRSGDIQFFIGHVNVTLGPRLPNDRSRSVDTDLTIDFLPPSEIRGLRTRAISEDTVVAMYMNNRAAELLTEGRVNDAYWWARAAIGQDPGFLRSYNTLGVIYRRHGNPAEAETVLAYALEREPDNLHIMSNLVSVLDAQGRVAESRMMALRLEQIEPDPPFSFYNRGLAALRAGNFRAARDFFAKEIDRAPYYHEFHYWLAVAYVGLGEMEKAKNQLTVAMDYSTSRKDRDVYAAKLDRIRSSHLE